MTLSQGNRRFLRLDLLPLRRLLPLVGLESHGGDAPDDEWRNIVEPSFSRTAAACASPPLSSRLSSRRRGSGRAICAQRSSHANHHVKLLCDPPGAARRLAGNMESQRGHFTLAPSRARPTHHPHRNTYRNAPLALHAIFPAQFVLLPHGAHYSERREPGFRQS